MRVLRFSTELANRTFNLPHHEVSFYRINFNLPNHKLSIYRITNFQFTAYHVFQFTAIINFNLPYHENSIYRVMKILPNHRICEISIYHRTDKSISVHESSVLSTRVQCSQRFRFETQQLGKLKLDDSGKLKLSSSVN